MKKTKLIASLCMLALTICSLAFGVYAGITANFTASGTITFNAINVDCDFDIIIRGIAPTVTGATAETGTGAVSGLYRKEIKATTNSDETKGRANYKTSTNVLTTSVQLGDLVFDELNNASAVVAGGWNTKIEITIIVHNYSEFPIKMEITSQDDANIGGSGAKITRTYSSDAVYADLCSGGVANSAQNVITLIANDKLTDNTSRNIFSVNVEYTELAYEPLLLTKRKIASSYSEEGAPTAYEDEYYYRVQFGSVNANSFDVYDLNENGELVKKSGTNVPLYWRYLGTKTGTGTSAVYDSEIGKYNSSSPSTRILEDGFYILDTYVSNKLYWSAYMSMYGYADSRCTFSQYLIGNQTDKNADQFYIDYGLNEYFSQNALKTGVQDNIAKSIIKYNERLNHITLVENLQTDCEFPEDSLFFAPSVLECLNFLGGDLGAGNNKYMDWAVGRSDDSYFRRDILDTEFTAQSITATGYCEGYVYEGEQSNCRPMFCIG